MLASNHTPGQRLVVARNDKGAVAGDTRGVITTKSGAPMRIVLELTSGDGTVSGTLITAQESRAFWGWLELMSALELAANQNGVER
jgi:hypothetical protein